MTLTGKTWDEIKSIKRCGVFFIGETVYVVASSRTTLGLDIESEPILKIDRNVPSAVLGDAVLTALASFRFGIDPPDPNTRNKSVLLRETGFRSWKQFEKKALHVRVHLDRTIFVTPTGRDEYQRGYLHRPDLACECSTEAQEIGRTLLQALALCT